MSPEPVGGVLVKVCGLTDPREVLACAEAGVDWIGLNFFRKSPRWIDPSLAAEIVASLPEGTAPVGLFVDGKPEEVAAIAERVGLRKLQLHGDEPPEDLRALEAFEVVKAFRLADAATVDRLRAYLDRAEALGRPLHAVLVDAYVPGLAGGTGRLVDASILNQLPPLPRLILAGGLTPENVAERVARFRPWMVDTASGVESSPGRKDPARVAAFVRAAKG